MEISWWEPARANGVLLGYRLYFLHNNFTSVQTVRDNKSAMVETLTRLGRFTWAMINCFFSWLLKSLLAKMIRA